MKVFLFIVAFTRLKKNKKLFDPKSGLLDKRVMKRFSDSNIISYLSDSESKKILGAMSCLHSSQSNRLGNLTSGPGWSKRITGLSLFLDGQGSSGAVLERLAETGIIPALPTIRKEVFDLHRQIPNIQVRSLPPKGKVQELAYVMDNVDLKMSGGATLNMVAGGTIRIGFKSKEEDEVMRKEYIKKLPSPRSESVV